MYICKEHLSLLHGTKTQLRADRGGGGRDFILKKDKKNKLKNKIRSIYLRPCIVCTHATRAIIMNEHHHTLANEPGAG